ncbi:MAG: ArsR/SmtB family transcription factor [Solirubrobacteraceae bacterium]
MSEPPERPELDSLDLFAILRALAEPVRMQIVKTLAESGEQGWGQLRVPVAKSTLSQHLKVLRDAGITRTRKDGQRCFVSLREQDLETQFPGVFTSVLAAARQPDALNTSRQAPATDA